MAQQAGRVGALARLGQEGPLHVEAERLRAVRGRARHPAADGLGERREPLEGGGHRGGQERGHAAPRQGAGHAVERVRAAHGVVPAPAVDVDVDEAGHDGDVRGCAGVGLDGRDAAVLDEDVAGPDLVAQDETTRDGRA